MKKIVYGILKSRIFRAILNPQYKKISRVTKGKILISTCDRNRLGDFIMNNHALLQLQKYYSMIHCCTASFYGANRLFFENHCLADDFFILPDNKWKRILFLFKLRRLKADAVLIDYHPVIDDIYFYLAGIPVICAVKGNSDFATHEYNFEKFGTHYARLGACVLDLLSGRKDEENYSPFFKFRKTPVEGWKDIEGMYLSMHIGGATYWMRRWPMEKYLELGALYLENYEGQLLLVGGKGEWEENEKFRNALEERCDARGRITNFCGAHLNTTANILAASHVFVGNDSGPMQIANAVNTRVVAIFGPSLLANLNPAVHNKKNIPVYSSLDCVPCGKHDCRLPEDRQFSCLTDLAVSIVWEKLHYSLNKAREEMIRYPIAGINHK